MSRIFAALFLVTVCTTLQPRTTEAIQIYEDKDFTLGISLRMQPRLELERIRTSATDAEWRRDFLTRRTRFGAHGKMMAAQYKLEWKIDGTDRLNANPSAQLENGYIQFPLGGTVELRAGLYDLPYSRDRLTSDSKQMVVDRGNVSGMPDAFGLADNGVGFHVLGKGAEGRVEYAVGLFDNRLIPTRSQDVPMIVGRLDFNFGSTQNIFQDAHFGEDRWYSLGVNGSFQGSLGDTAGADEGSNTAVGVDGMIDVPMGPRRFFARAEINDVGVKPNTGGNAVHTTAWMVGAGILLMDERVQPTIRYDQIRRDDAVGGGTTDITYAGVNYYRKGHNLKFQSDIRFEGGTEQAVDGARLQAQIDF